MEQYNSICRNNNQSNDEKQPDVDMIDSESHAKEDRSEVINQKKIKKLKDQINSLERRLNSTEDDLKTERSLILKHVS